MNIVIWSTDSRNWIGVVSLAVWHHSKSRARLGQQRKGDRTYGHQRQKERKETQEGSGREEAGSGIGNAKEEVGSTPTTSAVSPFTFSLTALTPLA